MIMNNSLNQYPNLEKTLIFTLVSKVTAKNMQNIIFFLQDYNLTIKRIHEKSNNSVLKPFFLNSNFLIEGNQSLTLEQITTITKFLNQSIIVTGVIFQKQILSLNRVLQQNKNLLLEFWNKTNFFQL